MYPSKRRREADRQRARGAEKNWTTWELQRQNRDLVSAVCSDAIRNYFQKVEHIYDSFLKPPLPQKETHRDRQQEDRTQESRGATLQSLPRLSPPTED